MINKYPPLNLEVRTPWPFDDPMSLYADRPDREWRWLRAIWAGCARVEPGFWRLYFVVLDGEPIGMQDLTGSEFTKFGMVFTFSWLAAGRRGRGIGAEMRAAVLRLAFAGLGAREAARDGFIDNHAFNRVSRALGCEPNGADWDTRCGQAALIQRWRLTRDDWDRRRRDDIELVGVQACLPALGLV